MMVVVVEEWGAMMSKSSWASFVSWSSSNGGKEEGSRLKFAGSHGPTDREERFGMPVVLEAGRQRWVITPGRGSQEWRSSDEGKGGRI